MQYCSMLCFITRQVCCIAERLLYGFVPLPIRSTDGLSTPIKLPRQGKCSAKTIKEFCEVCKGIVAMSYSGPRVFVEIMLAW